MNHDIFLPFNGPLYKANFIERPNRFVIRCKIIEQVDCSLINKKDNPVDKKFDSNKIGKIVTAHLADPGRLNELLIPGRNLWVRYVNKPERKTEWSTVLCERPTGDGLVSLDSTLPNRLVALALKKNALDEFSDYTFVRAEFKKGTSRWDFLLKNEESKLLLEVKSVTLVEKDIGLFPDAVTKRGTRHVKELMEFSQKKDWEGAVLFVIQRDDVKEIRPAEDRDPVFAKMLRRAAENGVSIFARRCSIGLDGIRMGSAVPVEV